MGCRALSPVDSSAKWGRVKKGGMVVVGRETSDTATCCCRLTPGCCTPESLLPQLQSSIHGRAYFLKPWGCEVRISVSGPGMPS